MEKKRFSIVKKFPIFAIISLILIAPGLVGLVTLPFGLNLFNMDVDFVGGTSLTFNLHTEVTSDMSGKDIPKLVEDACGVAPSTVQKTGENDESVLIKCTKLDNEQQSAIVEAMQETYNLEDKDTENVSDVNATIGREAQNKAVTAAVIAVILMLLYITIRFEFTSGLAAVTCLAHDLLVILSAYIVLQIPFNTSFIAVALTILGYSINASIIVFDRVRENRRFARRESFDEIVDTSVWQTVRRTLFTSITTLLTIGMIFIFGVTSLRQFTLPIIVGIVAGGYSSIFLAGSLWAKYRSLIRKNRQAKASAKLGSKDSGKPKKEEPKAAPEASVEEPKQPAPAQQPLPRKNNSKKNKRKKKKR
ncbi:MAG: protein translocase subunit SecF [Eubacteriales bacterium]|nr:protein translocase subunit SecF [Eubacteriales bacterium]